MDRKMPGGPSNQRTGRTLGAGLALVLVWGLGTPAGALGPGDQGPKPEAGAGKAAAEGAPGWDLLPWELLWQPALADPHQPRMYVKTTTLQNEFTQQTIDTAIGGTIGLARYRPEDWTGMEYQVDFFAVHFSRWSERHLSVAGDYRYGFPITFRSGPWQGKVGYEHTSTHLGDDHIEEFGRLKDRYVRDEVVVALSYRWWNQLRVYGEAAYAFGMAAPMHSGSDRYSCGVEWSRQAPTGWKGQPFAAIDFDLRPEFDFDPGVTVQAGWQWLPEDLRVSFRMALEYYEGPSTYGQFATMDEDWLGFGIYVDF